MAGGPGGDKPRQEVPQEREATESKGAPEMNESALGARTERKPQAEAPTESKELNREWNLKGAERSSLLSGEKEYVGSDYRRLSRDTYKALNEEARQAVADETNRVFRGFFPQFDPKVTPSHERLDPGKPEHRPFVRHWLGLRDELVLSKTAQEWEQHARAKEAEARTSEAPEAQKSEQVKLLEKTEPAEIERALRERLGAHGVDRTKLARNLLRELSDSQMQELGRTRSGFGSVLLLQGALLESADATAQRDAERIGKLFTKDNLPPPELTSLQMSQGILGKRRSGQEFLALVERETGLSKNSAGSAAIAIAKRLTPEHIRVASATPEGLQALTLVRKNLATGSFDDAQRAEALSQQKRIADVLVPGSAPAAHRESAYGLTERHGYGKGMWAFITSEIAVQGPEGAIKTMANLSDGDMRKVAANSDGQRGLIAALGRLAGETSDGAALQSARILNALHSQSDPIALEKRIEAGQVSILPVRHSIVNNAPLFAVETKDGMIRMKLSRRVANYELFENETKTLDKDVFLHGKDFKPDQIVGFRMYDEGGAILYRPAAYALELNHKSVKHALDKAENVAALSVPGPGFTVGAARLSAKVVDLTARAVILGNMGVQEHRAWLIESFGESGRTLVELMDRLSSCAKAQRLERLVGSSLVPKLREAWRNLKLHGGPLTDSRFTSTRLRLDGLLKKADDPALRPTVLPSTPAPRSAAASAEAARRSAIPSEALRSAGTPVVRPEARVDWFLQNVRLHRHDWPEMEPYLGRTAAEIAANQQTLVKIGYKPNLLGETIRTVRARADELGLGTEATRIHMMTEARISSHLIDKWDEASMKLTGAPWSRARWTALSMDFDTGARTLLRHHAEGEYMMRLRSRLGVAADVDPVTFRGILNRSEQLAQRYVRFFMHRLEGEGLRFVPQELAVP